MAVAGTFQSFANYQYFTAGAAGSIRVRVNSAVIPEPQEYALLFGLFALGFVIVHRRMTQKKRQSAIS